MAEDAHHGADIDRVFKALADPTRRQVLDRLREREGQTLGELCARLAMTRQSASQHLDVLEAANLISTVRRGREKLHYLNPVPLHDIQERWIDRFERSRLRALSDIRRAAEEQQMDRTSDSSLDRARHSTGDKTSGGASGRTSAGSSDSIPTYVYVTYIKATPEQVWHALTDADLTAAYWGHSNISDWQVGSTWTHVRTDGSDIVDVAGTVVESVPSKRLVITFDSPEQDRENPSRVTFSLEPYKDIVRLTVEHENLETPEDRDAISHGWPAVCANLKSLLETGSVLPQAPWEMHTGAS